VHVTEWSEVLGEWDKALGLNQHAQVCPVPTLSHLVPTRNKQVWPLQEEHKHQHTHSAWG